jgi:hypothetical protein
MKSGVLYLYGGIWEEGEKDFKLRGRNNLFSFCSTHIRKRYIVLTFMADFFSKQNLGPTLGRVKWKRVRIG